MGLGGVRESPAEAPVLVELASGIDGLYLSGHGAMPPQLAADLETARQQAVQNDEPRVWPLGETELRVFPRSLGRYRWRLGHENGVIGMTDRPRLPTVRIQPRSEFLHGVGVDAALQWFRELLLPALPDLFFTVNRLDLYADWQGWDLEASDRARFVLRARRRDTHEEGESLTGFEFGRRKTGTISARIYDKSLQVQRKGLDWWPHVWGENYDRGRPVVRVEFEVGRKGLRDYGLDGPEKVLEQAPRLWTALTNDWMTFRTPTSDSTRARWPISPEWVAVQGASLAQGAP